MTEEVPLSGGRVTSGVVRIGGTLRRLRALEEIGFDASPRLLDVDEFDREILTFIEGDVPTDCGRLVWEDAELRAAAQLLRRFHDATASSSLRGAAEVVCHNDFGPWNLVWKSGFPIAIIDFDNAAPGSRVDDLGYAAWKHLNLGLIELSVAEQRRRLAVLTDAYGANVDEDLLQAIGRTQVRMRRVIESATNPGRDLALLQILSEQRWLRTNGQELIAQRR